MPTHHDSGISKFRRIAGYLLSVLASVAVLGSGVLKFFPDENILGLLERLNLSEYRVLIGLIEIFVVVLYWIPRTANLGFFLFCSYVGGIVVGELVIGDVPLPGLAIGGLVYVGTLLRKPSLLGE